MLESQYLVYGLYALLFILVFLSFLALFSYLRKNSVISNSLKNFYEKAENSVKERWRVEKSQEIERGYSDKENLLIKLDKTIKYSNIRKYIPFLNSNIFIFVLVLLSATALILGAVFGNLVIGIGAAIAVSLTLIIIVLAMANVNYKKTEENILTFVNLVENYSKTNNDLIAILGKTYPYLDEPLKGYVQEAYLLGKRTGDPDLALTTLQNNVQNKRFREIVRNLQICSHYEANYEEVVNDLRQQLIEYLAGKRNKEAMARNARIELSILIATSGVVMYLMGSFMSNNIFAMLNETFVGKLILLYIIIVLAIALFNMIFMNRNKE